MNEAVDNPSAEPEFSTNHEAKKKSPELATIQYMHSFWSRVSQCSLEDKRSTLLRNGCAYIHRLKGTTDTSKELHSSRNTSLATI